jgi:hypothetical protein
MAFLEQHLPRATAAQQWVGRDDIFPLQTPQRRSAFMSAGTTQISSSRSEPSLHVTLKPGILCGEREYQCWRVDEVSQITASASCSGFAVASYEWSINGKKLAPTSGSQLSVQYQTDVSVPQPNRTVTDQPATTVQVDYLIQPSWNRSTLFIRNDGNDGIEHLKLDVSAVEKFVNDASMSVHGDADLPTLYYEYTRNFADDQRLCNGDLVQMSADLAKLSYEMELALVAPDPQPDLRIAAVLAAARVVNARVDAATENMGSTAQVFLQELGRGSRIAEEAAATRNRAFQAQPPALETHRKT